MRIVLWDTRHGGAFKDFAGGFGVGQFRGRGLRAKVLEGFYKRDFRSPPLAFGYLAAGLREQGHEVSYVLEKMPLADVYIFNPALMTAPHELAAIARLNAEQPRAKVIVCGQVASTMPEFFDDVRCTVVNGEPERLIPLFDEVIGSSASRMPIGVVANLDELPFPDWSIFPYGKFRVGYDFWKFPTAYIQSSRGCTLSCSYCPYIILENKVRTRSPDRVGEEIRRGMTDYGFRSFKFRDPLFGAKKKHALEVIEQIHKLPRKIQFSVESRIELLPREMLEALRDAGLTSVTVGIETPNRDTLVRYKRAPVKDDKQGQFVDLCRSLGIRVISGFMIGFPEDTRESIREVLRYAKQVNPFVANFNVCTPYPGTGFIDQIADKIASRDWSRYDVYTPNLKYDHLTPEGVRDLHEKCFKQFYFRWSYLKNWPFLLPRLHAAWSALTSRGAQPAIEAAAPSAASKTSQAPAGPHDRAPVRAELPVVSAASCAAPAVPAVEQLRKAG